MYASPLFSHSVHVCAVSTLLLEYSRLQSKLSMVYPKGNSGGLQLSAPLHQPSGHGSVSLFHVEHTH